MDHDNDTPRPPPAGWKPWSGARPDLAAGRTMPLEPMLERMRDSIKRIEVRRAAQDAEAAGQA